MGRWTWLTPYVEPWERKAGSRPNCGRLAKELGIVKRTLCKQGLTEEQVGAKMLRHWLEYISQTPVRFLSPTRFRETFNAHDPAIRERVEIDKRLDAELRRKEAALTQERSTSPQPSPLRQLTGKKLEQFKRDAERRGSNAGDRL